MNDLHTRKSLFIALCSLLTLLNVFSGRLFSAPDDDCKAFNLLPHVLTVPPTGGASARTDYLLHEAQASNAPTNILRNKFMRSDLSLTFHSPVPATRKLPMTHKRYVTVAENCVGLGNEMWRLTSLYAVAKATQRHIFFRQSDECMRIYERELAVVFPELYKQIYFVVRWNLRKAR